MKKNNEKEIFSSCCAFGNDGTENVHVLKEDCPIERELGQRVRTKFISVPQGMENPEISECTCSLHSGFRGMSSIPPCPHYEGTKKVTRNQKKVYKVFCKALESGASK